MSAVVFYIYTYSWEIIVSFSTTPMYMENRWLSSIGSDTDLEFHTVNDVLSRESIHIMFITISVCKYIVLDIVTFDHISHTHAVRLHIYYISGHVWWLDFYYYIYIIIIYLHHTFLTIRFIPSFRFSFHMYTSTK